MRPVRITQSGVGDTVVIPLERYNPSFNVGITVTVTGTVTYTVQSTSDNPFDSTITPEWADHPTLVGLTVKGDGNYAFLVAGVRLRVTAGTGTATITVNQTGAMV